MSICSSCKGIAFSVETGESPPTSLTYTTDVCRNGDRWKWALAEPAVERRAYAIKCCRIHEMQSPQVRQVSLLVVG
jgi:hypothetical protein